MSYTIHQTRGVILAAVDVGEAKRFYAVYTEALGLIGAVAQGVRYEKSKLRYALQLYAHSGLSLVRGRGSWRITGAEALEQYYYACAADAAKLRTLTHIARLVRRISPYEDRSERIYQTLVAMGRCLSRQPLSQERVRSIEYISALRVLHALGYVSDAPELRAFLAPDEVSAGMLEEMHIRRSMALAHINRALSESQL